MFLRTAVILCTGALVSACGGGGSDGGGDLLQGCLPIGGGGSTFNSVCNGCSVNDGAAAMDRDGATYATLVMGANSPGSGSFRVTAQNGVIFPAGSLAGMVHSISYGPSTLMFIALRTYLAGALQEDFTFNNGSGSSSQDPSKPGRVSYTTSLQYNAIELSVTRTGGSGTVEARVHEFCSN
jgi:hypothetical protein